MSEKRQKNRSKSALEAKVGSEASETSTQGFESSAAIGETESLAGSEHLMKEVLEQENLKEALKKVMQNKGAAGIDGMSVDKLPEYLKEHWKTIRKELMEGK